MQDKYNNKKNELKKVMVNKSINIYQNKRHKQIMINFVDFQRKYRNKDKIIENKENI